MGYLTKKQREQLKNNKQNITLATPSQWFKIGDYYKQQVQIQLISDKALDADFIKF